MQQQANPMQMQMQNNALRDIVVKGSLKMKQEIFSATVDPTAQNVINIGNNAIRSAGLLLGFVVEVSGNIVNADADALITRTPFGTANMIKEIRFDDISNYTRIQAPGWYLATLNTARLGYGYGGVYANALPMDYADNYNVFKGPATIAANGNADVRHVTYVPISYSNSDLRGAIYMNTVNANSNLQITLNPTPVSAAGNKIDYVYTGNNGNWSGAGVKVVVYQVYLSQLPTDANGQVLLPMMDLATTYDLKQTAFAAPTVGQDFPMQYANERSYLSTFAVFDNGGSYNGGTDVNYWALRSANFTNLWKVSPQIAALDARHSIMSDFPDGAYYFESRDTPINTVNFGNMELVLNVSTANAGARVLVGWEAFALTNLVAGASSLGGG